ncbi:hypothetical protein EIN_498940, partial [Entamoeba invadens IP1]
LWIVVVGKRKELNVFFNSGKFVGKWRHSQFITWIVIFSIIHISLAISLIMGYGGLIMSGVYIVLFFFISTFLYFLHSSSFIKWNFKYLVVLLSVFLVSTVLCTLVLICLQPFVFLAINGEEKSFNVKVTPNQPIEPFTLTSPPWNCFNPEIISDIQLPQNLTVVMSKGLSTPIYVRGIVSGDIPTTVVNFKMKCSGLVHIHFDHITFKSCSSKPTETACLSNKCGWCGTTQTCGYCEDGGEFCTHDGAEGCGSL